jgi:hypothetical protein
MRSLYVEISGPDVDSAHNQVGMTVRAVMATFMGVRKMIEVVIQYSGINILIIKQLYCFI